MSQVTEFNEYRQRMNATIMAADNKVIKRFFNLDTNTYAAGALDVKTKEMLGLACSMTRKFMRFLPSPISSAAAS
jgi:alkylhydroperoxidase/carboxymuconolactone decarboxylase family protein YurZ